MPTEPGQITKTERSQLIALIKLHFAVLSKEVSAEEKRMLAEVDNRVAEHARKLSYEADDVRQLLRAVTDDANKAMRKVIDEHPELFGPGGKWRMPSHYSTPYMYREQTDEQTMRRAMVAKIRSQAEQARLRIQRDQVERLREIHVDALVSSAARSIADELPQLRDILPESVGELTSAE